MSRETEKVLKQLMSYMEKHQDELSDDVEEDTLGAAFYGGVQRFAVTGQRLRHGLLSFRSIFDFTIPRDLIPFCEKPHRPMCWVRSPA